MNVFVCVWMYSSDEFQVYKYGIDVHRDCNILLKQKLNIYMRANVRHTKCTQKFPDENKHFTHHSKLEMRCLHPSYPISIQPAIHSLVQLNSKFQATDERKAYKISERALLAIAERATANYAQTCCYSSSFARVYRVHRHLSIGRARA